MLPWTVLPEKEKKRLNKEEYEKRRRDDYIDCVEKGKKVVKTVEDFKIMVKFANCLEINDKKYQFYKATLSGLWILYIIKDWIDSSDQGSLTEFKTLDDFFDFEIDGKSIKDWITDEGIGMTCNALIM